MRRLDLAHLVAFTRTVPPDDVPWLDADERATWLSLLALTDLVRASVDAQLERDAGLSLFEYTVLAMLSEQPDRTLKMRELARLANGSLSRLSHVARRLEARDLIRRYPMPEDGRTTLAQLTDAGAACVRAQAPAHVRHVRRVVFDPLTHDQRDALRAAAARILLALDDDVVDYLREHGLDLEA